MTVATEPAAFPTLAGRFQNADTRSAHLEGQSYLDVQLTLLGQSFGTCLVTTRIERPPGRPRAETFTPHSVAELTVGVGASLLTTGSLHELAPKPRVSIAFDFNAFFSLHHGATLDIGVEDRGCTKVAEAFPGRMFDGTARIEAAGFFLCSVARWPAAPWLTLSYSPQLGHRAVSTVGQAGRAGRRLPSSVPGSARASSFVSRACSTETCSPDCRSRTLTCPMGSWGSSPCWETC